MSQHREADRDADNIPSEACSRCGWSQQHHRAGGTIRTAFGNFLDYCAAYLAPAQGVLDIGEAS